ncbi:hypothetical protein K435DRAFT_374959 [Dendrothele bispora CBS 962.96]|uniref:Uncharacterized protein n=1 Tax=Dendrothele bispora (strain CBS 962.96) TaxID=1314807 RepID=A0A4S8LAT7_DENBC|nr:hypothetical protein K435DRAFT_374959 [Dendrothele bispora CBS 962.96]
MNNSNVPGSITDSVQDRDNFPLQSKSDAFELLRANYYALHDLTEISRYLSTAEHYIQDYEETIDKSEDEVLVSLRNRQKELHGQITWYRSLFAPIRRLPLEVLSRIFALVCVECKFSHKEIDCPSTRLSHVCAGWRELARSIPILWSHININFSWESSIRCGPDTIRSILTTHLELSQNLPLSVALIRSRQA